MLASQLIQSLEAAIEEHGDLEVMAEVPSEPLYSFIVDDIGYDDTNDYILLE